MEVLFFLLVCFLFGTLVANSSKIARQTKDFQAIPPPLSPPPLRSTAQIDHQWDEAERRRKAIREAIRRDPSLGADSLPETLTRLEWTVQKIEKEMVLREEVKLALKEATREEQLRNEKRNATAARKRAAINQKNEREVLDEKDKRTGDAIRLGARLVWGKSKVSVDNLPEGSNDVVIVPGSPAARAGLEPGDELVAINNLRITSLQDVRDFMRSSSAGDHVVFHVRRHRDLFLEVNL